MGRPWRPTWRTGEVGMGKKAGKAEKAGGAGEAPAAGKGVTIVFCRTARHGIVLLGVAGPEGDRAAAEKAWAAGVLGDNAWFVAPPDVGLYAWSGAKAGDGWDGEVRQACEADLEAVGLPVLRGKGAFTVSGLRPMEEVKDRYIRHALALCGGVRWKAAKALKVTDKTLYNRGVRQAGEPSS